MKKKNAINVIYYRRRYDNPWEKEVVMNMTRAERSISAVTSYQVPSYLVRYYSFYLLLVSHLPTPVRNCAIAYGPAMKITIVSLHLSGIVEKRVVTRIGVPPSRITG